jgi:Uma2 family endonuclease
MAVALLKEPPLTLPTELGPYRRRDYYTLPPEPRCELIFGRFYLSPSPLVPHQIVVGVLFLILDRLARATGGLALLAPTDVPFADHSVVQPDVLYISAANRAIAGDQLAGIPDLLVEVLSPGTVRRDRGEKLALYAQSSAREYWIVDYAERQVEFLVNQGGHFVMALPTGSLYRSPVLPEIQLDLAELWKAVEDRLR